MTNPAAAELIARSNRLGSDPKNTNYAGGNTSAKGTETDPVTGEPVELLWVKGSGGDLGTLTEQGLAVLRLDRMRALVDVYPGLDREDEMVAAFDYCLHGKGGAAPSIDTAMHGLVDAAHVDHLHPDSGIAIATAKDGAKLTKKIFGSKVVWVPWRRPGFQLGLDIAAIKAQNPGAIGCILGGHGITAWGDTSDEAEANSLWIIETAQAYIDANGKKDPFGKERKKFARAARGRAPRQGRRPRPDDPRPRIARQADGRPLHRRPARARVPRLGEGAEARRAGHELPRPLPSHEGQADAARPALGRARREGDRAPEGAARGLPRRLHRVLRRSMRRPTSPAIRGADPLIVLVPGVGMFSFGANKQTARVAGEFYLNAINVMRGAEALSTYSPISDAEKFRIEYWALEEAKLQRMPKPKTHQGRIAFVTGAASGIGKAIATRLAAEGACVVVADLDLEKAQAAAAELGGTDVAIGVAANVADAEGVQAAIDATRARVRRHRPRRQQRRPLAVQAAAGDHREGLGPAARRHGEGLVPRLEGRREGAHRAGHGRRCDLHLVEELRLRRPEQHRLLGDEGRPGPPGAPARGRTRRVRRARQRHQPRRRRPRLGHLRRRAGARTAPRLTA